MKSGQKKKKINKAEVIGKGLLTAAHCTGISHLAGIPGV